MDNAAKEFARKIVNELETIKRLIHDAVSLPHQEKTRADHDERKSNGGDKQSKIKIPHGFHTSQTNPTISENTATEQTYNKRTEWLKEHIVEVCGVIVVAAYTTVTACQLNATLEANRINRDNFRKDERPYLWLTDNMGAPHFATPPNNPLAQEAQIAWGHVEYVNYGKSPAQNIRLLRALASDLEH